MLPSEMCPRGISLVMSDVHMPRFYRGGEKGVEKAEAIGSLPLTPLLLLPREDYMFVYSP